MPVTAHNLRRKVEHAVQLYLAANVASAGGEAVNFYRSVEQADIGDEAKMPSVACVATGSQPVTDAVDVTSGMCNRIVALRVVIATPAAGEIDAQRNVVADAGDRHDSLVGAVMEAITRTDFVAVLNQQAVPGVTIEAVALPAESFDVDGRAYRTALTFDVQAVSEDVT